MISTVDPVLAADLRFALESMKERSHLVSIVLTKAENLRTRVLSRIHAIKDSPAEQSEVVAFAELPD